MTVSRYYCRSVTDGTASRCDSPFALSAIPYASHIASHNANIGANVFLRASNARTFMKGISAWCEFDVWSSLTNVAKNRKLRKTAVHYPFTRTLYNADYVSRSCSTTIYYIRKHFARFVYLFSETLNERADYGFRSWVLSAICSRSCR